MPNQHGLVRSERAELALNITEPYLTAKKDQTMLQQYERVYGGPDRRVRTVLSPVVTETGRLASGESFVDPYSTNMQNISKKQAFDEPLYGVRDIFIPDPGMTLVACDLDKAEAVVMAFESENWTFYEKIVRGEDVHRWVAAQAYHAGNQKSVAKEERQRCKNVLYASLYMAGVPKITSTINADAKTKNDRLTEAEVQVVYDAIMDVLELNVWWDRVWADLMDPDAYGGYRWLENALGFRRMFYNPNTHERHKEAVNFFPQSTVANVIDLAMIDWWEQHDVDGEAELLLQVHDELLFQVKDDKIDEAGKTILSLLQQPFKAKGREVFLPSSMEVGQRWGQLSGWCPYCSVEVTGANEDEHVRCTS